MSEVTEEKTIIAARNRLEHYLANYLESSIDLWVSYVDPRDAYTGPGGERWQAVGIPATSPMDDLPYQTQEELHSIQTVCRKLARENAYAINGHKNRINYLIGNGHNYSIVGRDKSTTEHAIKKVKGVLDQILAVNKWCVRQREIKLRDDRDGETYIRKFRPHDGIMRFRFIEPRQIQPPSIQYSHQSFGVETLPEDQETIIQFWVDGKPIPADQIQQRKWNTDSSVKRGCPLMWPIRDELRRAMKLLKNMSIATEIQTAIALIRKHEQATKTAVRSFIQNVTAGQVNANGKTENVLHYPPGSILDSSAEYTIPPQLDPSKTVAALQAELRACASALVMPEFMFSSDASNANFSSTMVAEGPAAKNFESEQEIQIQYDRALLEDALQFAADSGLITHADLEACELHIEAPLVSTRNYLEEAQIRQIDMGLGILSVQTATAESNREYDKEQTNIELHAEKFGSFSLPTGGAPEI